MPRRESGPLGFRVRQAAFDVRLEAMTLCTWLQVSAIDKNVTEKCI